MHSWKKINELTSSHFRSYADAFRQLNNTWLFIIAFHVAFEVTDRLYVKNFLTMKNPTYFLCKNLLVWKNFVKKFIDFRCGFCKQKTQNKNKTFDVALFLSSTFILLTRITIRY